MITISDLPISIFDRECNIGSLASIIVTYNPNFLLLATAVAALPPESALIIIDNASHADSAIEVQLLATNRDRTLFVANKSNIGLAAALNQGANVILNVWPETLFLLLLDQDSVPQKGAIAQLIISCQRLMSVHNNFGCVGPQLVDTNTGLYHGFHSIRNYCWIRSFPSPASLEPVPCHNINGSGTLMPIALFNDLGGLDESLFIDHVDTDWSFKVLAAGGFLYGIPNAIFQHSMGESCTRFWFGRWRTFPLRSPSRHYYLFRNALWLMHRNYVPTIWKFWATLKLLLTFIVHMVFDRQRLPQMAAMIKGIREGLRNKVANQKENSHE